MGEAVDESMISQEAVKPKKGPKGKGKKSKKEEADLRSKMDVDANEPAPPEPSKPRRVGRPRKRTSEEMARDDESVAGAEPESSEPAQKRRATRTRSSSVSQTYNYESQDHEMLDDAPVEGIKENEPKKTRKGLKKGTSKGRKASDVSATSKPTSKARLPRDSEIEAEIEAGLEADYVEPEQLKPQSEIQSEMDLDDKPEPGPEKPRASKKTKSGKKSKAAMKSFEQPEDDVVDYMDTTEEQQEAPAPVEPHVVVDVTDDEEAPAPKIKSSKTSKKKGTKKAKKQEIVQDEEREPEDKVEKDEQGEPEHHHSSLSVEAVSAEPEPEPQPEMDQTAEKPKKKSSRKEDKPKKSKKIKKVEASPPPPAPQPVEDELGFQSSPRDEEEVEIPDDLPDQIQVATSPRALSPEPEQTYERTPVPPKTTKRFSDIPREEHLAQSLADSHRSQSNGRRDSQRTPNQAISPLPVAHQGTPSLSPQSSDAENRPPSSLPSSKRPIVVASPPKEKTVRTPLAASTPSPSKRNLNAGFPASAHPWTPVDIDEVLFGDASDKENADLVSLLAGAKAGLTSPEKRMTVEEWIMWNAKNGEERLKRECERLVSQFEKEGDRAMRRLEAIECID